MARKLAGEASAEEEAHIENLLKDDQELKRVFAVLVEIFNQENQLTIANENEAVSKLWRKIHAEQLLKDAVSNRKSKTETLKKQFNLNYMAQNYFKIAWRNLWKNKTFSIVNIAGLTIGVACFLLIGFYVYDELNFDKCNSNVSRIYRVDEQIKFGDFLYNGAGTPAIMGPSFTKAFTQVEQFVRLKKNNNIVIKKGVENIREERVVYADSTLFKVFTFPMISGNPNNALTEPHSLVITESIAKKYFGSNEVVGKTMLVNDNASYKITAVVKDIPTQSHFHFDFFMPLSELDESRNNTWFTTNCQTYVLLKSGTNPDNMTKAFNVAMNAYEAPQYKGEMNMTQEEFEKAGNFTKCSLTALSNIHLHSNKTDELETNGSIQYVYIFSAIAIFILLIACVNFINLSTAQSSSRAKEVAMRKVLGGNRKNLIAQFLTESLLISVLSFILAILLILFLLPLFNQLTAKNLDASILLHPFVFAGILLIALMVGLVAGSYPAFVLSSYQPIQVMKAHFSRGIKGLTLRNALVVFQFSISIVLIIATVVIYNQLSYIRNKDIGFNKDQVLILKNTYALNTGAKAFQNELAQMPNVKSITSTGFLPITGDRSDRAFVNGATFNGKDFSLMQQWPIDENYIPTLQIQLKSGRNFSPKFKSDSNAVIINEAAAKLLGIDNPINKKLSRVDDVATGKLITYNVIGVIKNFNFNSLHEQIAPLVFNLQNDNGSMALRISANNIPGLIAQIKDKWKAMAPSQPFSYYFLDEEFARQYNAEDRTGKMAIIFSTLAILIACLGLFGLVTYAAARRTKEIGIRKVVGASVGSIIAMLSKDFIKLVIIAIVIASPIAWWAMSKWLQGFAYRIDIGWWVFVTAGLLAIMIALATVSFQSIKAAVANPVKSLRTE